MFRALRDSLLSIVLPQECSVCSGPVESHDDGVACSRCWSETRLFDGSQLLCVKCGAFFGKTAIDSAARCHQCDDHHYDQARAAGVYEKALAATIINLKSDPVLSRRAAAAFVDAFDRSDLGSTSVIIPVPLSKRRMVERGFNQAEILGRLLSRKRDIPIDCHSLFRKGHTPIHRVAMDMKARELTVRNAFDVRRAKLIEGQNVLLVDDVLTSGSTTSYCAKVLKKNCASRVNVITLARAISE